MCLKVERLVDRVELLDWPASANRIGPSNAEPPSPTSVRRAPNARLDTSRRIRLGRNTPFPFACHGASLSAPTEPDQRARGRWSAVGSDGRMAATRLRCRLL